MLDVNALESYDYHYGDSLGAVLPAQLVSSAYAALSFTSADAASYVGNSVGDHDADAEADGGEHFPVRATVLEAATRVGGGTRQFGDQIATVEVGIGVDAIGNIVPGYLTSGPEVRWRH